MTAPGEQPPIVEPAAERAVGEQPLVVDAAVGQAEAKPAQPWTPPDYALAGMLARHFKQSPRLRAGSEGKKLDRRGNAIHGSAPHDVPDPYGLELALTSMMRFAQKPDADPAVLGWLNSFAQLLTRNADAQQQGGTA